MHLQCGPANNYLHINFRDDLYGVTNLLQKDLCFISLFEMIARTIPCIHELNKYKDTRPAIEIAIHLLATADKDIQYNIFNLPLGNFYKPEPLEERMGS